MTNPTYRSVNVDGLDVFYREAGNPDAQTLLLLHGFPTSGHMFRDLIPLLSDRVHIVAPEAGGGCHGNDDCPSQSEGRLAFLIILDDRSADAWIGTIWIVERHRNGNGPSFQAR
jgi:pimeloyl-ACP methyl ester carboxylesterase